MSTRDREPLTPEERDIAQRLSRLGAHAEPSPALDAKILAAARAAAAPAPRRLRPRWAIGMGVAASLALAIGMAWQLRPLPQEPAIAASSEAEAAAVLQHEPPAPLEPARVATPPDANTDAAAGRMQAEPAPAASLPQPMAQDTAPADAATLRAERAEPTPLEMTDAAPRAQQSAAPASAPPPPAPPAPVPEAAPAPVSAPTPVFVPAPPAAARTDTDARRHKARNEGAAAMRVAVPTEERRALDSIVVTGSRVRSDDADAETGTEAFLADQPDADQPPASFDSPESRDAWLERIRELQRDGKAEAARESLREFARRYPQHAVPDDLKALLEE